MAHLRIHICTCYGACTELHPGEGPFWSSAIPSARSSVSRSGRKTQMEKSEQTVARSSAIVPVQQDMHRLACGLVDPQREKSGLQRGPWGAPPKLCQLEPAFLCCVVMGCTLYCSSLALDVCPRYAVASRSMFSAATLIIQVLEAFFWHEWSTHTVR
jgi:hypothetical protein